MMKINRLLARLAGVAAVVSAAGTITALPAQTDYYNTDAGRPVQIEDAYPVERYAFELQLAPLRLERARGGVYSWGIEPEIAYGIARRTQVEIGLPLAYVDLGGSREQAGVAGLDIGMLHNLNVETASLPALGIGVTALLPLGSLGPERAYTTLTGIATRTFRFARFHVNAQYTFGATPDDADRSTDVAEVSRWLAGVAVDRVLPLRSMLLIGDIYAEQPLDSDADVAWNAGAGVRYQWSPRLALDAGLGRRFTGDDPSWFVTFGAAYAFAIRSLIPVPSR